MEWVVGGGIGMGNTCKPMAVSFQCMTKFTINKKKLKKNKVGIIVRLVSRTYCIAHGTLLNVVWWTG